MAYLEFIKKYSGTDYETEEKIIAANFRYEKIKYQIPDLSFVTIIVYDVLGKEITTLVNNEKPSGNYEIEFDAEGLPSGIYFYRLQAGPFVETKKMVLMK